MGKKATFIVSDTQQGNVTRYDVLSKTGYWELYFQITNRIYKNYNFQLNFYTAWHSKASECTDIKKSFDNIYIDQINHLKIRGLPVRLSKWSNQILTYIKQPI